LPIFKLATKCKLKVYSLAPNKEMELKFWNDIKKNS
jgi:hypothetical protein